MKIDLFAFKAALLFLIALLSAAQASAQVDRANQTTPRELAQVRRLAESHKLDWVKSSDIDWRNSEVWRVDLDGDGKAEAIFTYEGTDICGFVACQMLIIKWRGTKAVVVSMLDDGLIERLNTKTNGWYDLQGHYFFYKWNGHDYDQICRRDCSK